MENKGDLVDVRKALPEAVVQMRYASCDNFVGEPVYERDVCLLRRGTAKKLGRALRFFNQMGLTIKIWDAYRPSHIQYALRAKASDPSFFADPVRGSKHSRGASVDVTLVDKRSGRELEMPSGFDEFSIRARRAYPGITAAAMRNVQLLTDGMLMAGFAPINSEWWHYDDTEAADYPLLDVPLEAPEAE
nr:M15 family metallopeptidase [Maliibacterium massiliense]